MFEPEPRLQYQPETLSGNICDHGVFSSMKGHQGSGEADVISSLLPKGGSVKDKVPTRDVSHADEKSRHVTNQTGTQYHYTWVFPMRK